MATGKRSRASSSSSSGSSSSTATTPTARYSLRKRTANAQQQQQSNDDTTDATYDSDTELELLLNQHEEDGIRERDEKRNKKTQFHWFSADGRYEGHPPPDPVPLDDLPSPCIELIFEMLDSPRDVYNLAFSSKFILSHVNSEIVVRSAVHENIGQQSQPSKNIIGDIVDMVKKRSIHVPSALRLLRLLNAKRCERGDLCWGYDLEKGLSHALPGGNTKRSFGLALCCECIKGSTVSVPRWYNHFALGEDRVALCNWNHVFQPNAVSELGGEVGPIIHARHIFQISSTHVDSQERQKKQKEALQQLIVELYGEEGSDERTRYESRADELVEIHAKAEADLESYRDAKNQRDAEKWRAKNDERIAKRVEKTAPIFDKLQLLLDGAPQAELALEHTWNENKYDCLSFKYTFAAKAMERFVSAPSSATQKALGIAAAQIRQNLQTLSESDDFFTFSFLEGASSSIKQSLRTYCIENFSSMTKVLVESKADAPFLELLQKKYYMTAILRVLRSTHGRIPTIISLAFVPDGDSNAAKYRSLAKIVWEKFAQNDLQLGSGEWSPSDFRLVVNACRSEFRQMKQNARDYLARPDTVAYLRANVLGEDFNRQEAIDQVFSPKRFSVGGWGTHGHWGIPQNIRDRIPYNLLMSRNFELLLEVHQYYYRRGRA